MRENIKHVAITVGILGYSSLSLAAEVPSLPQGPSIVHGNGTTIETRDTTMTITPGEGRTWINWNSYNVAAGHTVVYAQGPDNLTVNNVIGASLSSIAGTIQVQGGHCFLINTNGIVFKDGALIDGNMTFSTVPMNQESFTRGGDIVFSTESAGTLGSIHQEGTFEGRGVTTFVGPQVNLTGHIIAPLEIYSGKRVAARLGQDGLMGFDVTEALENHQINVQDVTGKHVVISASTVEGLVDGAININGEIKATGMAEDEGGRIFITGGKVEVGPKAVLDVSHSTKAGEIRIGVPEDYVPNKNQEPLVQEIIVNQGAKFLAKSPSGAGGNIYLLGKNRGSFYGSYDVSGKTQGGFVELSSRQNVSWPIESINLSGEKPGTLRLDPGTLTIVQGIAGGDQISTETINKTLATGYMILEADNLITMNNDAVISWGSDYALSMLAPDIALDGTINYTGGNGHYGRLNLYTTTPAQAIRGTGTLNFDGGYVRSFNSQTGGVGLGSITQNYTNGASFTQYQTLSTALELVAMSLNGNYAVTADIDMSGIGDWTAIGAPGNRFVGRFTADDFNGGRHTITINMKDGDFQGLFGIVDVGSSGGSIIDNVHVRVATSNAVGSYRGALVGLGNVRMFNVSSEGTVSGQNLIGGLAGYISSDFSGNISSIKGSSSAANVTGSLNVGGLVGHYQGSNNGTSLISNSQATGTVTGADRVGGLVGWMRVEGGSASIISSSATGAVTGNDNVGGLVGDVRLVNGTANIMQSDATGNVAATGSNVGNFIGGIDYIGGTVRLTNANSTAWSIYLKAAANVLAPTVQGLTIEGSTFSTSAIRTLGSIPTGINVPWSTLGGGTGINLTGPLTVNGNFSLNESITSSGNQNYNGAVTLSGNATLTAPESIFGSTINASSIGGQSLTVTGNTTMPYDIGRTAALSTLTITGTATLGRAGAKTEIFTTSTQSYGPQILNGDVILHDDVVIPVTFGPITYNDFTIMIDGNRHSMPTLVASDPVDQEAVEQSQSAHTVTSSDKVNIPDESEQQEEEEISDAIDRSN